MFPQLDAGRVMLTGVGLFTTEHHPVRAGVRRVQLVQKQAVFRMHPPRAYIEAMNSSFSATLRHVRSPVGDRRRGSQRNLWSSRFLTSLTAVERAGRSAQDACSRRFWRGETAAPAGVGGLPRSGYWGTGLIDACVCKSIGGRGECAKY